jgi:hypothetical protein
MPASWFIRRVLCAFHGLNEEVVSRTNIRSPGLSSEANCGSVEAFEISVVALNSDLVIRTVAIKLPPL